MEFSTEALTAKVVNFKPITDENYSGYFIEIEICLNQDWADTSSRIVAVSGSLSLEIGADDNELVENVAKRAVSALFK